MDSGPAGTATPSTSSLSFASQPPDTLGPPQALTVTNSGHGALRIGLAQVTGSDPDDFLISHDTCSGATLTIGAACTIGVRFSPSTTGTRTATLTLTSDDPSGPLQVTLAGTAGAVPQGPAGATGVNGTVGPAGAPGRTGTGTIELVTCRTVTKKDVKRVHGKRRKVRVKRRVCTVKTITGTATFTRTGSGAARAALVRGATPTPQG